MTQKLPVRAIIGPTASGKTALACEAYARGGIEIISMDSALIYRGMDIGTAKPSKAEQAEFPHALIDIREPWELYSTADFIQDCTREIDAIHQRGNVPLVVGGTMLYLRSLLEGLGDNLPAADINIRQAIEKEAKNKGWAELHAELASHDPQTAARLLPSDSQRISRALEVFRQTGVPLSVLHAEQSEFQSPYNWEIKALFPERDWLHGRIAKRLALMWTSGFLEEVVALRACREITKDLSSIKSVGYRQVWDYLDSPIQTETLWKDTQDKALYATRQLAKRQYTWIRSLRERHAMSLIDTPKNVIVFDN